jgi:class 3 adenylate cyclase
MTKSNHNTWVKEKYKDRTFIVRAWYYLVNIGIDENTSLFNRKRVRLLNGISVISIFANMVSAPNLFGHLISEIEWAMIFIAAFVMLFLNSMKKYGLACHAFNIWNIAMYTFCGIIQGANDHIEMFLIPSCVISMMFFKRTSTFVIYFITNALCYGLVKYLHTIYPPINTFPEQHNILISNNIIMFIILFLIIYYFKSENRVQEELLEQRNIKLNIEKERSDKLLLNILPAETAEELKSNGLAQARKYDLVTVMFTDFKNFTEASEKLSPEELVKEINHCYSEFDRIIEKYGIEKIKTIGDSYMCAGGLPATNDTHPWDVVNAGLELQKFIISHKEKRIAANEPYFELRLGIHTGPVVAGIVGIKKFAYDIWGDTVNTASRMESSGEVGKVNISGTTYQLVKDKFTCIYRGKVQAKNKGEIDMYFVT